MKRGGSNLEGWREVVAIWKDSGRMKRGGRNREGWREVVGLRKDGERLLD